MFCWKETVDSCSAEWIVRADASGWCFFLLKKGMLGEKKERKWTEEGGYGIWICARGEDGAMINTRRSDNYIRHDYKC